MGELYLKEVSPTYVRSGDTYRTPVHVLSYLFMHWNRHIARLLIKDTWHAEKDRTALEIYISIVINFIRIHYDGVLILNWVYSRRKSRKKQPCLLIWPVNAKIVILMRKKNHSRLWKICPGIIKFSKNMAALLRCLFFQFENDPACCLGKKGFQQI